MDRDLYIRGSKRIAWLGTIGYLAFMPLSFLNPHTLLWDIAKTAVFGLYNWLLIYIFRKRAKRLSDDRQSAISNRMPS
jgi:hypothetical protein